MQYKKLLLLSLYSILAFGGYAQNAGITGTITDRSDNAITGATLLIKEISKGTSSDINGNFSFSNLPSGTYTLEVRYIGYESISEEVHLEKKQVRKLNLQLSESAYGLEAVTISAKSKAKITQELAYNVDVIDTKQLKNSTLDIGHALDRVSGVRIRESGGVGSRMSFSLNGFTGKQVKFFIDGVPMENFGSSFQLNNIPVNLAQRIEVYKGVVPIELGADALGGAVNIVTSRAPGSYIDASYSFGSFNTHKTVVNAEYVGEKGFIAELNAFQNYSDNNYWVNVDVADINTGKYYPDQKVKRFHDRYHNETIIANVGIVNKPFADRMLFGVTLGQNYSEIQTGARLVSVYGDWHRKGSIIMPGFKYKKEDLLIEGLDLSVNANYNLGKEQNIDTVHRRYNWFQEYRQYNGEGSERSRSLYKYSNNTGVITANATYPINKSHSISINSVLNSFNRQGSDELYPENDEYDQPRKSIKNIAGIGYKYAPDEKWSTSVFLKHFFQKNNYSQSYNPTGEWGDVAYLHQSNTFNNIGYGIASTYFINDQLQLKASYEKSYRLPETDELYGDLVNLQGNIELEPEKSNNYNFGARYFLDVTPRNQLTINGNIIYRDARDFIRPRLNNNQTMQVMDNLFNVTNLGLEGEIRYFFKELISAGINLTYQNLRNNTKYEEGQSVESVVYRDRIPNMPFLFGNADASIFLNDVFSKGNTLTIGYNMLYVHAFYLYWPSLGSDKLDIPEQISHDLNFTYSLQNGRYNITAECRNMTDARLYDNFSLQKPGRSFIVKLRYFINNL